MIVAAGLTPAWQQILVFDSFEVGAVNRAREVHWCSSGKVLNAGIALGHLGGPCQTVALVGGPPLESIEREFAQMGVPRHWVASRSPTRICTTILDRATGTTTELVENAKPVESGELDEFLAAFAREAAGADVVVLIGSLPAGTPVTFYRELLQRTSGRAVIDARGEELLATLDLEPFLVKPNREELARTVGRPLKSDQDLAEAMQELNRRGATWVVVTHGRDAVWVSSKTRMYRLRPPAVEAVNPIGCGDALAAGTAWALGQGRDPIEAVRFGMAAAAENLRQLLPCRLDPTRVAARAQTVFVEEA
ncbi:MAG: 1-phosphofructokinase family hexose kinase [Pirellulales bacterium]